VKRQSTKIGVADLLAKKKRIGKCRRREDSANISGPRFREGGLQAVAVKCKRHPR